MAWAIKRFWAIPYGTNRAFHTGLIYKGKVFISKIAHQKVYKGDFGNEAHTILKVSNSCFIALIEVNQKVYIVRE
jgi:hypothetical protein